MTSAQELCIVTTAGNYVSWQRHAHASMLARGTRIYGPSWRKRSLQGVIEGETWGNCGVTVVGRNSRELAGPSIHKGSAGGQVVVVFSRFSLLIMPGNARTVKRLQGGPLWGNCMGTWWKCGGPLLCQSCSCLNLSGINTLAIPNT